MITEDQIRSSLSKRQLVARDIAQLTGVERKFYWHVNGKNRIQYTVYEGGEEVYDGVTLETAVARFNGS